MPIWHNYETGAEQGGGPGLVVTEVQKASGTWVDITADVLGYPNGGVTVQAAGRQTELSRIEDGLLTLVVDNRSGDYTPGYASAPTSFFLGMPVRVRETVGRRSQYLFTGFMNQPEAVYNGPNDESVIVTCVDWSGGQQQGRQFISNLGEWVLYNGGDTLAEYYPMTETSRPWLPAKNPTSPPIVSRVFASSAEPADGFARITPAAGEMPLGEDARIPVIGGPLDSLGIPAFAYHLGVDWFDPSYIATAPPIAQGQVCTTVVWIEPTAFASLQELFRVVLLELPSGGTSLLTVTKPSAGAALILEASGGDMTGTVTGSGMETGRPYPIAIRHGTNPTVFELWQDRKRYVGTLSGTPATSMKWGTGSTGAFWFQGSVGHLQIYVGAAADFTFDDYLAQISHVTSALTGGYARQRTDERLRTIARYAGLTDAQLDFDQGVGYMPRASFNGKTFVQLRDDVVATEQGRALIAGNGNLQFHNRSRSRYAV